MVSNRIHLTERLSNSPVTHLSLDRAKVNIVTKVTEVTKVTVVNMEYGYSNHLQVLSRQIQ